MTSSTPVDFTLVYLAMSTLGLKLGDHIADVREVATLDALGLGPVLRVSDGHTKARRADVIAACESIRGNA